MIKKIGTTRFIFDTERCEIGFVTIKGKIHYRKNFVRKRDGVLCCEFYEVKENGRRHFIRLPLSVALCVYGYGMDLEDKIVYFDKGKDLYSIDNIVIKDILEICDRWVIPHEFDGRYKLSGNGDVYDTLNRALVFPPGDGEYFTLHYGGNSYFVHRLVYKYFIGEIPNDCVIDHKDNNIFNNSFDNLQAITQNENIKKERVGVALPISRYLSYNNKKYFLNSNYGVRYNANELNLIFFNALAKAKNGEIENCYCDNQHIHFNFLTDKWCVHSFPSTNKHNVSKDLSNIEFSSLEEAESYFHKICDENGLKYLKKSDNAYEYYKSKGSITFRRFGYCYRINISDNRCKDANDFILKSFLNMPREDFINKILSFKELQAKEIEDTKEKVRIERKMNYERLKEEWVKKRELKNDEIKKRWSSLEAMDCYSYSESSGLYSIFCYYKGKKYTFGTLNNVENAIKINELIKREVYKKNDFHEWFKYFKENIFNSFRKDEEVKKRIKMGEESKGYDWFAPRNCWRSKIRHNGKTYTLGYFKNKECCELIYKEALSVISLGKFERWFDSIKEHRNRITDICY